MKIKPVYNSFIPKLLKVSAITLYPFIFFAKKKYNISNTLYKHEMIHVEQIRAHGVLGFYGSYIIEYLKHRFNGNSHYGAYMAISWEKVAYKYQYQALTKEEKTELSL